MKGELMKTYIAYFDETGDDGVTKIGRASCRERV